MRLNVIGKFGSVFNNLYALDDEGGVYVGKVRPQHRGLTDCQIALVDLEWVAYPKSRAPKHLSQHKPTRVIDVEVTA